MLYFDIVNIIIATAGLINLVVGIIIYIHQPKSMANRSFFLLLVILSLWSILMVLFRSFADMNVYDIFVARSMYAVAFFIPILFLSFVTDFIKSSYKYRRILLNILVFIISGLSILIVSTDILISEVSLVSRDLEPIIIFNKITHTIYILYVISLFNIAYFLLIRSYLKETGPLKRQIMYVMVSTSVAFLVTLVTNLAMPLIGNFELNWVGQISLLLMSLSLVYGIYKDNIFNARVATVELLVSLSLILSLTQIIISSSFWLTVFSSVSLVFFGIFGVVLLKTINHEIKAKEELFENNKRFKKLNKRLKEMDKKKNEFLHIATHQLRGPITAIKGYTSLLREGDYGKIEPEMEAPIDKILSASKVMSETIADYMNIARIEEDDLRRSATKFDLCELVRESAETMRINAEKKNLRFKTNLLPDSNCTVLADKNNITQVINVLLENAIKYTDVGNITVEARLVDKDKRVQVSISDTGIGVAKHEVAGLFDKFTRADNAKKSDAFGTGMGLFIAKSLIEANGGSIAVSSKGINKGTTFTIELPRVVG